MATEKGNSFEDNIEASGEYLICFTFAQFGSALEKGASDSTAAKLIGKSFGSGPGIIIGAVKEIKKGSTLKEALIEIGIDTGVDLLLGKAAPIMIISKIAHG